MLVFRHLVVVSAGAVLACGYGVPAMSQVSPANESLSRSPEQPLPPDRDLTGDFAASAIAKKSQKASNLEVEAEPSAEEQDIFALEKKYSATALAIESEAQQQIGIGDEVLAAIEISSGMIRDEREGEEIALDEIANEAISVIEEPELLHDERVNASPLDLLWEAEIPTFPLESTEDLAQNSPVSTTREALELAQFPPETDPDVMGDDNEDESLTVEDTVEEIVEDATPLQNPEASAPPGRQIIPPPENLAPSGNPLLFPTEPDEVTIDISQPITLDQAIALARQNNQDWRKAWLNLEKADAALRQALAANFPTLSAEFNISRTDSATTELSNRRLVNRGLSASTSSTATDLIDGTLQLSYTLYDGGSRPAQIRQAEETVRFNQLEVERISEELRLSTANAYYNLQESNASVGIEQAAVDAAKQTLRDAVLLERAGLGTRFDVLRANVDLANSQQNLVNARANRTIAKRQLVQVLALGEQVEVTIADKIERSRDWDLSLEETIILAYRNRAELEQQLVQREIDEQQRQVALSVLRPQVSLFANYNVANILNFGEGFADGYAIGATLSWTLFDGGAAQANSRQEELDIEIAEANFEQQRKSIRVEVEEAYENLQSSDENIKTAVVAVQLAEESLRLARLRFQAGVGTQTEVIDAQTELTRARGNLLTATVSYNRALASLQRAVSNVPDNRLFDLP